MYVCKLNAVCIYIYFTTRHVFCILFCFFFSSVFRMVHYVMWQPKKKKTKRTMECVYVVVQLCEIICQRKTGFEMVVVDQHRDGYLRWYIIILARNKCSWCVCMLFKTVKKAYAPLVHETNRPNEKKLYTRYKRNNITPAE